MAAFLLPAGAMALAIDGEQQLKYADKLFINQQYLRAAEEYQRFTFFFPDHPKNREVRLKSGEAFLLAKDTATAIGIFKALSNADPLDKIAVEAFFKMTDAYLAAKAPSQAVLQLNNIITISEDSTVQDRAYYRIGWIHIDHGNWTVAMNAFARISPEGRRQYDIEKLNHALARTGEIPTKHPTLAGVLSIVPGGGQLYCQRYEDALIAFIVNTGLIWAASDAFDNEQYGLGGLLAFVAVGFYSGNIYGAVNDAHKYNHGQRHRFIDELKNSRMQNAGITDESTVLVKLTIPF